MTQPNRLPGGEIDTSKTLTFQFDGKTFTGHPGDTLASALLANGVRLMGRSFKYHRPRGPLSAGSEEPNALVELRTDARREPNVSATMVELFEGLEARSQNRWPSLSVDVLAVNDMLSPFLSAGFYYKTFMWPAAFWEKFYEPAIRKAAGLGSLSLKPDPDSYDKGFLHCDLLIIGSGPAGLAAALTAGRAGADVILADEDFRMGGRLNAETMALGDQSGSDWAVSAILELESLPNVRLLARTTVFGVFDHGVYGAVERANDHMVAPEAGKPRQILWRIYSRQSLLCAGATERPVAFENNDRPGIMLAGAIRSYANRWAAVPDRRIAIFTNNSDGYRTADDLIAKGVDVAAVVDVREDAPDCSLYEVYAGAQIINSRGRLGLESVRVRLLDGSEKTLECGALGVSGGWNPNVHLTCHRNARPQWNDDIAAFVPGSSLPDGMRVAGATAGVLSTSGALNSGATAAVSALENLGYTAPRIELPAAEDAPVSLQPFWFVGESRGRAWVDLQNDVTTKDIELSHQEGFRSVEHLKRYTTLGMGTDQGKTSNLAGLAIMAQLTGTTIPEVGTTTFRPPYTPTSIGALAGRARGKEFVPTRLTPSHQWAVEKGAVFIEAGNWMRAQWFPQSGETHWRQSVDREVLAVRKSVGVCDVTTLGKIDVQGTAAAAFLDRIYCNTMTTLAVGRTRYGLILREDGMVMDDGTAARLAADHFVVTTTTANAVGVYGHMEFVHQCLFPDMDVQLISTTEAWAQYAVAGPNSRVLLQKILDPGFDLSNDAFPFMECAHVTVCGGLRARLFRISFSGELAYEIAVPTPYGDGLIREIMAQGAEFDIVPYGTEALGVMRIEKGHAAGNELNGTTTAGNLGLGRMVSTAKDSIGSVLAQREGLNGPDVCRKVGIKPVNPLEPVTAGAHLMRADGPIDAAHDEGYVTSACHSPSLGHAIAIAFLKNGDNRMGEILRVVSPLTGHETRVEIVSDHFVDPEGGRVRA
jgi:heterotetrameric sarcosine oxidase alpha subunit